MKNKKYIWIIISILIIIIPYSMDKAKSNENNDANIIYIGGTGEGNYSTIQEGIEIAEQGNTIFVYEGIYYGQITLYKTVKLIGENNSSTIIDGIGKSDTIYISSDNCTIKDFTIRNSSNKASAGINLISHDNKIENNIIFSNTDIGIYLYHSKNNSIINNIFKDCGIYISGNLSSWNTHTIKNNSLNNKKIFFYKNKNDVTISNSTLGQIILVNCTNFIIKNIKISSMDQAIVLGHSSNNLIKDNILINNKVGILLDYSSYNKITGNVIENNSNGLRISHSVENDIFANNISINKEFGCWICCGSNNNLIYLNNFVSNNNNAYDAFKNQWYNDEKKGNYWSDYEGVDNDNDMIGDKFYDGILPNGGSIDPYPLINRYKNDDNSIKHEVYGFEIIFTLFAILVVILWKKNKVN